MSDLQSCSIDVESAHWKYRSIMIGCGDQSLVAMTEIETVY